MIANEFEPDREYSEPEVNDIINSFEVEDYALVRRELVNFNYLAKDSYKGIYTLKTKQLSDEQLEKIKQLSGKLSKMD